MDKYGISIELPEGRIKEIMDKLTEAQDAIYSCYSELQRLGVLTIKEKSDSGN